MVDFQKGIFLQAALFFLEFLIKNHKSNQTLEIIIKLHPKICSTHYEPFYPTQRRCRGRGVNIMVETVVKAKVDELEDEVREEFLQANEEVID